MSLTYTYSVKCILSQHRSADYPVCIHLNLNISRCYYLILNLPHGNISSNYSDISHHNYKNIQRYILAWMEIFYN